MINDRLKKAAQTVIDEIAQTPEYAEFTKQKKNIDSNEEAKRLLEKARDLQHRIMSIPEEQKNSEYVDLLQNEYEEITEYAAVYDYLRAEAVYVTMIQEVLGTIVESVDV